MIVFAFVGDSTITSDFNAITYKTVPKEVAARFTLKDSASERLSKSVQRNLSMSSEPTACPRCSSGKIVLKHSRESKQFFGCSQYPRCTFSSTHKPIEERCPDCSSPYLIEKPIRKVLWAVCPNKHCKYERRLSLF